MNALRKVHTHTHTICHVWLWSSDDYSAPLSGFFIKYISPTTYTTSCFIDHNSLTLLILFHICIECWSGDRFMHVHMCMHTHTHNSRYISILKYIHCFYISYAVTKRVATRMASSYKTVSQKMCPILASTQSCTCRDLCAKRK